MYAGGDPTAIYISGDPTVMYIGGDPTAIYLSGDHCHIYIGGDPTAIYLSINNQQNKHTGKWFAGNSGCKNGRFSGRPLGMFFK